MRYSRKLMLKDGRECCLRNGTKEDGGAVLENFRLAHEQTDFLLSYPEELSMTPGEEGEFLEKAAESESSAELLAEVEGRIAGLAGVHPVGEKKAPAPGRAGHKPGQKLLGTGHRTFSPGRLHRMCGECRIPAAGAECCLRE